MSEIVVNEGRFERIENYTKVEPGQYWRLSKAIPESDSVSDRRYGGMYYEYEPGVVLLVRDVRDFDGKNHTVVIQHHPGFRSSVLDEEYSTFRMLVEDFFAYFEPAPDGEDVRRVELEKISLQISEIQSEIAAASADPTRISGYIEKRLAENADRKGGKKKKGATALIAAVPRGNTLPEILSGDLTQAGVAGIAARIEHESEVAKLHGEWVSEQTKEIGEIVKSMMPYHQERAVVALARTAGIQRYAATLRRSLDSLSVYVGTGVEVEQLVKGRESASDIPLTICQRRLFVEEEMAAWVDVSDGKFDFTSMGRFHDELATRKRFVDQIFPTERCVVAMAIRRTSVDYFERSSQAHAIANEMLNSRNKEVFLLVRNGENIYEVRSPIDSHVSAHRLFPGKDEFDAIFRNWDSEITLKDLTFTDAADKAKALSTHYKRFLVLIAGLNENRRLFGQFYSDRAGDGPGFVTKAFQERYLRFIHDADGEGALPNPERSVSAIDYAWSVNSHIRAGSRVIVNLAHLRHERFVPAAFKGRCEIRDSENDGVFIVHRRDNQLCITLRARRSNGDPFNAVCVLPGRDALEDGVIPYLVLDAVDPDRLEWYVFDRESRPAQVGYIRAFKKAVAMVRADIEAEKFHRAELRAHLIDSRLCSSAEADPVVHAMIRTWRANANGAALPATDSPAWPKAVKEMMTYAYSILRDEVLNMEQRCVRYCEEHDLFPLRLTVDGKGRHTLITTGRVNEVQRAMDPGRWVLKFRIQPSKSGGISVSSEKYIDITRRVEAGETVVAEWPKIEKHFRQAHADLSFEEEVALVEQCRNVDVRLAEQTSALGTAGYLWAREFHRGFKLLNEKAARNSGGVSCYFPFAMARNQETGATVTYGVAISTLAMAFLRLGKEGLLNLQKEGLFRRRDRILPTWSDIRNSTLPAKRLGRNPDEILRLGVESVTMMVLHAKPGDKGLQWKSTDCGDVATAAKTARQAIESGGGLSANPFGRDVHAAEAVAFDFDEATLTGRIPKRLSTDMRSWLRRHGLSLFDDGFGHTLRDHKESDALTIASIATHYGDDGGITYTSASFTVCRSLLAHNLFGMEDKIPVELTIFDDGRAIACWHQNAAHDVNPALGLISDFYSPEGFEKPPAFFEDWRQAVEYLRQHFYADISQAEWAPRVDDIERGMKVYADWMARRSERNSDGPRKGGSKVRKAIYGDAEG
jgi:hypothetical protein